MAHALAQASLPTVAIDPFSDAFLSDPYACHDQLREAGPVFWLETLGIYGMARHAEVSQALKDWQTFVSGRGVGLSDFAREEPWRPPSLLLETDPPVHDRTRGLMNRVVNLPGLRRRRETWQAEADDLVGELLARGGVVDGVRDISESYPLRVFPDTIGLRAEGRHHLIPYATAAFNSFGPRNALFHAANDAAVDAIAWVNESCRREELRDGGWGKDVYRAADEGLCTEDEAMRLVRSFLSAGVDTTVNGIGNMLHAFAAYPDQWQALRADPSLAKRAFEESLRWDSTVQTFFRTVEHPVEVGGTPLEPGSKVLLFLAAANRDPRRWTDPERFDITRSASGHVGFGFGIHQCLGQMVARQEAEMLLNALIPRVSSIRLAGEPKRRLNNTLHALESLPLELVPA